MAEFECNDGTCIFFNKACDGVRDCAGGEDEDYPCGGSNLTTTCRNDEFQCSDGTCILKKFKCDGKRDCSDGNDDALFLFIIYYLTVFMCALQNGQ